MPRATPLLGAAAALLLVVSIAIAVVRPGDLGDGDETSAPTTIPSLLTTTTGAAPASTSTSAATATTATSPTTGTVGTTPTPVVGNGTGSGLGVGGAGQVGDGNLVNTGGPLLALPGLAALAGAVGAGSALRRRRA